MSRWRDEGREDQAREAGGKRERESKVKFLGYRRKSKYVPDVLVKTIMLDHVIWQDKLDTDEHVYSQRNSTYFAYTRTPFIKVSRSGEGYLKHQIHNKFVYHGPPTSWPNRLFLIFLLSIIVIRIHRRRRTKTHSPERSLFDPKVPADNRFATEDCLLNEICV